jgi:hypothetical protein
MECEGQGCQYNDITEETYSWFSDTIAEHYKCEFFPRTITAESENTLLFANTHNLCTPKDTFCELHDSILIWDQNIIHNCPYERLWQDVELYQIHTNLWSTINISKNKLSRPINYSNIPFEVWLHNFKNWARTGLIIDSSIPITPPDYIRSNSDYLEVYNNPNYNKLLGDATKLGPTKLRPKIPKLLFKITNKRMECNRTIYKTAEGFYLTNATQDEIFKRTTQDVSDIKTHFELILAENDFSFEKIHQLHTEITKSMCFLSINTLRTFSLQHDRYLNFIDSKGQNTILYSNHGTIYKPSCTAINKFEIINQTNYCYRDTPITFKHKNKTINGFITTQAILRPTSQLQQCNCSFQRIILPQSRRLITKNGSVVTLNKQLTISETIINLINSDLKDTNDITHDQRITEDINVIKQVQDFYKVAEIYGDFLVIPEMQETINPLAKFAINSIETINNSISYSLRYFTTIFLSIITCILVVSTLYGMYYIITRIWKIPITLNTQRMLSPYTTALFNANAETVEIK